MINFIEIKFSKIYFRHDFKSDSNNTGELKQTSVDLQIKRYNLS